MGKKTQNFLFVLVCSTILLGPPVADRLRAGFDLAPIKVALGRLWNQTPIKRPPPGGEMAGAMVSPEESLSFQTTQCRQPGETPDRVFQGERFVVGNTVTGQPIELYKYGPADAPVFLWISGQHGNEHSAVELIRRWSDFYRDNPGDIPTHLQLWIVPIVNKDGFLAGSRFNSRRVDLNRNFPTENWQQRTFYKNRVFQRGGGKFPLSEPESQAMYNLVHMNRNKLLMIGSIHCCAKMVISPTESQMGQKLARLFSHQTGFKNFTGSWNEKYYQVSGSFLDYTWEKLGIPYFFIELSFGDEERYDLLLESLRAVTAHPRLVESARAHFGSKSKLSRAGYSPGPHRLAWQSGPDTQHNTRQPLFPFSLLKGPHQP